MTWRGWLGMALASCYLVTPPASAQNNQCDQSGEAPDIIVGAITLINRYGTLSGLTSYSIGTDSCNIGTCWADWIAASTRHPVIGQNLFRLKDGRFEQLGQSWLKHVQQTVDDDLCGTCLPADGAHLGVNCSDPYGAGLNGAQASLGPKFEVDAAAGTHAHPFTAQGATGNVLYKRLQARNTDLDPLLNAGALYFVEAQYVARDDADAGNQFNNASYRRVTVSGSGTTFNLNPTGPTFQQQPAIYAWAANDATVQIAPIAEQYVGAVKVVSGGTIWRYEYALQNVTSTDAVRSFRVPIPRGATVTNIGFHDVDYHSGEPFSLTDWTATVDTVSNPNAVIWSTQTYDENANANALRWGTLYNFRFDIDAPPDEGPTTLVAFQPLAVNRVWTTQTPKRCGDGSCDVDEGRGRCPADCGSGAEAGSIGASLRVNLELNEDVTLDWDLSCVPSDNDYAVYEGTYPNFTSHASRVCSTAGLNTATFTPAGGTLTYYLVVPGNGMREGSYGQNSASVERPQALIPCHAGAVAECDP